MLAQIRLAVMEGASEAYVLARLEGLCRALVYRIETVRHGR
jgi:hypothetical protein